MAAVISRCLNISELEMNRIILGQSETACSFVFVFVFLGSPEEFCWQMYFIIFINP